MKLVFDQLNQWTDEYSTSFVDCKTRILFVRVLNLYLILKIILSWNASMVTSQVIELQPIDALLIRLLFLPGILFEQSPASFLVIGIVLSCFSMWRPNYLVGGLLFWYVLNYFRVHNAFANGADIVLVTLVFLVIGLSCYPQWKKWTGFQMLVFNGASVLIKIQITIIYLLSGVDKLYSQAWRNGEAIHYMLSLDYLMNPTLAGTIPDVRWLNLIVAWFVILFEILFPFLIWNTRTRRWMLIIGTLFHLAISIVLSLVDFGVIMIIAYMIFLKDEDLYRLGFKKRAV